MIIKKIVIDINGKDVDLSLADAKKLYEDLHCLFGSKTTMPLQPWGQRDDKHIDPNPYRVTFDDVTCGYMRA